MNRKEKAEEIFTKIFLTLTQNYSTTNTFIRFASIGKPRIKSEMKPKNKSFAWSLFNDKEYEDLFINKEQFINEIGDVNKLEDLLTAGMINSFDNAVNAASIVFMHSALDAIVTDLCQVSALIAPDDWFKYIKNKEVSFKKIKNSSYEETYLNELDNFIKKIDNKSLIERTQILFSLCQPSKNFQIKSDFSFKQDQLKEIDSLRHEIVHDNGILSSVENVEDKVNYLLNTGVHLLGMINKKYDVKLNPLYGFNQ